MNAAMSLEEASVTSPLERIGPQLGMMTRWVEENFRRLQEEREPRNCRGVFVYAVMLDESALVSKTSNLPGLEIRLDDGSRIIWWSDFYDSARRHRTVLGVFDAAGELVLEHQIAPRGWDTSAGEAEERLKKALKEIGVAERNL